MSGGFSFGSPATQRTTGLGFTATTSTLSFGTPSQPTQAIPLPFGNLGQSGLSFGAPQQQVQQPASGLSFGAAAGAQTTFGSAAGAQTAFGATGSVQPTFGATGSVQPTFGAAPNTQPTFGAGGSVQPAFGATGTTQPTFGAAPSAQPTFGAAASTQPTFGQPAAQTTSQTGLGFGTPQTTPQTGLTFGTPSAAAATTLQTGLSFGTPASAPQAGLTFGTPATSAPMFGSGTPSFGQTGLTFGTPATAGSTITSTTATTQAGFSFGGSAATTTASTLGAPATTAQPSLGFGLNFGAPTTAVATTSAPLSFGSSVATTKPLSLFGAPTATTTTSGLSFGLSAPSTSQPGGGFSLGTGTATGGLFGLSGKTFGSLGSTTAPTTTTATTSVGLGGVDPSQSGIGLSGGSGRTDTKVVKENQVPNEVVSTVDNFKIFLKAQKNLSSDVARGSVKPLNKVQEEIESCKQMLASLQNGIQRSSSLVVKLKTDTAKCLQHAEMAQRTHDTPAGLQYDNTSPMRYFEDLVTNFEHEMKVYKLEISNTEKHLLSLMQPMPLTSQELALAMRRLHDSFVALAGRLQSVHHSVETEKNQYLLLRKYFLKDSTNVFEEEAKKNVVNNSKTKGLAKTAAGPTPFSALGAQHGYGLLSSSTISKAPLSSGWSGQNQQQPQQPLQTQQPSQLQQTQFQAPTLSSSLFSSPSTTLGTFGSPQPVENQNFQLQKPPLGNKRGKR